MKLRPFELALIIIFGALAILAIILLSNADPEPKEKEGEIQIGSVNIWGTLPAVAVNNVLNELKADNKSYEFVYYRQFDAKKFDSYLINSLAARNGPDAILVSHEKLVKLRRYIQPLEYSVPSIRSSYIDGAEIFAIDDGLYAYPLIVDPIMMYWNRDMLSTNGILQPPTTWESLINSQFPELIERDFSRTIEQSVVAMGEYDNVRNSFGILSALLLQGGSVGVEALERNYYEVKLNVSENGRGTPLLSAADFYTRFSKSSNALYSWNRSFREDRSEFAAENLAFYFGFGSEARDIESINPNLNFDIAEIPQGASADVRRTYGKFYGLSLLSSAGNIYGAAQTMSALAVPNYVERLAVESNMAPVYRSSLEQGSDDIYGQAIYKSAPVALGWLNPDRETADWIFSTMTSDINENRRDVSGAVSDAVDRLSKEYR